jgi:3-hydroxyacyl-CoA dehydrogenase
MASDIKTVGVVSTGVIGSSFAALCLARGLRVLVCSPSVGAEDRMTAYLTKMWPILDTQIGLSPRASVDNYQFVGETLDGHYDEIDFVQEVGGL